MDLPTHTISAKEIKNTHTQHLPLFSRAFSAAFTFSSVLKFGHKPFKSVTVKQVGTGQAVSTSLYSDEHLPYDRILMKTIRLLFVKAGNVKLVLHTKNILLVWWNVRDYEYQIKLQNILN